LRGEVHGVPSTDGDISNVTDNLRHIPTQRLDGTEPFHIAGEPLGLTILEFWQWACSDILVNTFRGWLAEFLVASDLGITKGTRRDWEGFDLEAPDGTRIEVKSSGYVQSWTQKRLSRPLFSIRPAHAWDPETDTFTPEKARHSDVYVFCLHHHKDKPTADPADLSQWTFFILATAQIDEWSEDRQSVTLKDLERLGAAAAQYGQIGAAIHQALSS
jgi:hypothetical protein